MVVFTSGAATLVEVRARFEAWLTQQDQIGGAKLASFEPANAANGYSNETYRVSILRGEKEEALILRLPPSRRSLFPDYDIPRQFAFMSGLQNVPGVPMAPCRVLEADSSALGRPFFLVDYIAGQIPPDQPMYLGSGWVMEASDAERSRLWYSSVDALAALSKVRWMGERLEAVNWPDRNRSATIQYIELYERWARWGTQALPPLELPLMDELTAWLRGNRPLDEEPGVVWGDSRFGNIIYQNYNAVALLDWEGAVIGDPEIDISYMLLAQRYHENQIKVDGKSVPRLGGFPSDEDTVEYYNSRAYRPVRNYKYYWLLNALKFFSMTQCYAGLLSEIGTINHADAQVLRTLPLLSAEIERVLGQHDHSAFFS